MGTEKGNTSGNQVDTNCFYQTGKMLAVYGRLVCLNPEENIMQIAYHPGVDVPSMGEVVVCRRDYFEALHKKAKAVIE